MKETLEEAIEKLKGKEEFFKESNDRARKILESIDKDGYSWREGVRFGIKWQQAKSKEMRKQQLEKELNRFFLYLRNSGEHFIGVPNEQFVKKYLEGK